VARENRYPHDCLEVEKAVPAESCRRDHVAHCVLG
jgi:hypothetical protein